MNKQIRIPGFVSFISSPAGRTLRICVGLAMIAGGLSRKSKTGNIVASLGLAPLSAGAFDICVLGPLLNGYFSGSKTRTALHTQQGHPELSDRASSWMRT